MHGLQRAIALTHQHLPNIHTVNCCCISDAASHAKLSSLRSPAHTPSQHTPHAFAQKIPPAHSRRFSSIAFAAVGARSKRVRAGRGSEYPTSRTEDNETGNVFSVAKMEHADLYSVLQVPQTASDAEVGCLPR